MVFAGVHPWNQHGQLQGYRIQIRFQDCQGRLDKDSNGLDSSTGLED